MQVDVHLSTGLPGLDRALRGLIPGDNIVWQIDSVGDYAPFVRPYCQSAADRGRPLIYFRFGGHEALLPDQPGVEVHRLDPQAGFEAFIADIHKVIERSDRGAWYVFDCLSELAVAWRSDTMLGNFFVLYSIARAIGKLMRLEEPQKPQTVMLVGPGRWGTSMPSLGVPVNFSEIADVSILSEVVVMRENLVPDVSLGTHFFNELVEADILYLALFPDRDGNALNASFFDQATNRLAELLPEEGKWSDALRVIDASGFGGPHPLRLHADTLQQNVVCYVDAQG